MAEFKLEFGNQSTAFTPRPAAIELGVCRHFYRVYANAQDVNDLAYEMRGTPVQSGSGPYTYSVE